MADLASDSGRMTFKVAPHIVEDLGLNLYTTLPRVLVEYIANAYDADAKEALLTYNAQGIKKAREAMQASYDTEVAADKKTGVPTSPIETRILPQDLSITIEDRGIGMSRSDLNNKFLYAGRRRRKEEPDTNGRTPKGRILMGRKGLGKLAGFGVAKSVIVTSRKVGEPHATRITLHYDTLVAKARITEIPVKEERIEGGDGLEPSGTRIQLSELLFDPMRSRPTTIESELADYFALVDADDFAIRVNGTTLKVERVDYAFAWPEPGKDRSLLLEKTLPRESGEPITFLWRIRFRGKKEALPAARRGVRVYAHKRLAAAPSLLGADTNMHGFRMTDYMDGVVHADFIDDQPGDYIATDRESLRWESPLLERMYVFLSDEIKSACKAYQKERDDKAEEAVGADAFTLEHINRHNFTNRERRLALRFAAALERVCKRGCDDPVYRNTLPDLCRGIGHGAILTAITKLAAQSIPSLDALVHELVRLSKDEIEGLTISTRSKIQGILGLQKIVDRADFRKAKNEKQIQKLFENCPWLVEPAYTQFMLAADVSLASVFKRLEEELEIGSHAKPDDRKEPDLVFLLGNQSLKTLVIVELKASNLELEAEHLAQLDYYMERAIGWLESRNLKGFSVHGQLIGTLADDTTKKQGAIALRRRMKSLGPDSPVRIRDYLTVLSDSKAAHSDLLGLQERLDKSDQN